MQRDLVVVTIAAVVAAVTVCAPPGAEAKLCGSLDIRNDPANLLKLRNCTMVMGYVKILLIDNVDNESAYAEYEFPELTEIAEYLFVFRVTYLTSIGRLFPNLRIIRGRNLFVNNYALVVFHMKYLQEIGLHNLYRIERGDIKVDQSPKICFVNTVDWKRIAPKAELHFNQLNEICQSCDPACNGYCWNSRYCQDVQTDDCHPECLGCTKKNSTSHCKSCKNVMDDNKCVQQCPPGKYVNLYMMKCITRHECTTMMNGTWWIFENQCVRSCPPRYELDNPDRPTSCVHCGDQCVKVCSGSRIDNMASLDDVEGCTHINGTLEIVVNDAELYHQLENKLGRLRVIRDKLKIYRSTALKSLHFLNNLTTVEGKELENLRYAIYVYENPNLQTLFNYSDVNFKLEIKSGTVAFHNNPQLCFYEIERLVNITVMNKTGDDIDSFRYSNGDKSTCNEKSFAIRIDECNPTNVTLSWDAQGNDTIGYTVYYTKTKNKNLTAFDSGDQCEKDNVWNSVFVSTNKLKLVELLPYTIYGYYIKTYSTTIWGGEHTPVDYFTTATDDPTEPVDFRVSAWDDTSIHLKWGRPVATNGELDHYNFTMLLEEDYWPTVEKRDYCRYPHFDVDDTDRQLFETFETTTEAPTRTDENYKVSNCSCGAPVEPRPEVGIFQVGIGALCRPDSHHNSADCSRLHYNLDDQEASHFSIGSNYTDGSFDYGEHIGLDKRTGKKGIMERNPRYRNFKLNNPDAQEYIFKDLRYYSLYIFFMRACNKPRTEGSDDYQCSPVVMTFKRTKRNKAVDAITHIEAEAKNRNAHVKWREPEAPNSFLVAYQIEYERKDLEHSKPLTECITRRQFLENGNQYQIKELSPGSYAVRVQAISLAGPGTYTRPVEFYIATNENDFTWLYIVMTIMFVGSIVLSVAYHRYRLKHRVDHLQLIQSINPDYAGPSYEEDEWEIDRNDIEIIKELGKGTFGMVHQGFIKSQNRFCAIKTATDSVSISDRLYFLHEGSVMKGFNDAYHVVKLLGIVSKGQPAYVVMELMDRGDLKSYLRRCREPSQNLTSNEMYRMAAEIADGMAYLAAKKYVHRDLAARNCMVSADRTVKIGDFGMARDIYETDYYRKETVGLLPVRWMAPESLADGVFTTDSDVWSYGVVLWEMATLAEQPYQGLSNEEVFHFVKAKGTLERPNECSDVFFEVMDACWMWRPNDRPTFRDIVNKLSTHVGEDFRLVAFCFSRQGIEHAMNAGPRVFNPPAMVTLPYSSPSPHHHNNDPSAPSTSRNPHYHPLDQHDDPFSMHYDAREEQVGLCTPGSGSRPPQIFPFNSPPHSAVMPSSSNQRTSTMSGAKGGGESPGSPPHSPASYSLGSSY